MLILGLATAANFRNTIIKLHLAGIVTLRDGASITACPFYQESNAKLAILHLFNPSSEGIVLG